MRDADLRASIRQADWPEPSPELRARVLRDGALVERSLARTDQIFFSRGWRWSLAAASVGVIALGYLSGTSAIADPPTLGEMARVAAIEETMREAGLPPGEAGMLARRVVGSRSPAWSMYASTSRQRFETFGMDGGLR